MKLLLDENLSPRLLRQIDDLFANSIHVRSVGLKQRPDREIWEFARSNGFAILTADADFLDLADSLGYPPKVTYGAAPITLSATATSGLAVSFATAGPCSASGSTLTITGQGACIITASQAGNSNYAAAAAVSNSIVVNPAMLTVTAQNAGRTYGANNPPFTATITGYVNGDSAIVVTGSPSLTTTATSSSTVGAYSISTAQGTLSAANYGFTFVSGSLTVSPAATAIIWPSPSAITYGAALGATQLNAAPGGIAGTFTYSPAAGAVLSAGLHTLSVSFAPADSADYSASTGSVSINVNPAVVTVTASSTTVTYGSPAPTITPSYSGFVNGDTYATAVIAAPLCSTTYTPTTVASATPTSSCAGGSTSSNYVFNYLNGAVTIQQAGAAVTWPAPQAIPFGAALSPTQLNAVANVGGTFTYTPAAGTLLTAGSHLLTVSFTPSDTVDYTATTATVSINVNQATPIVSWNTPAAIPYGTALSAVQLNASSATPGTFTYSPALGTVLNAGQNQMLQATFTPNDTANYTTATAQVEIAVNAASQTIRFSTQGQATLYCHSSITLSATSTSGLPITYSLISGPAALSGNTLTFTGVGTVTVAANQGGNSNYAAAPQAEESFSDQLAPLAIAANNATRVYGTVNPTFTGAIAGALPEDSFTETFSTAATLNSNAGAYDIVPAVSGPNLGNYTVTASNGTLAVTQASSTLSMSLNSASIAPNQPVTLTAQALSTTTGTPTGTVNFYDGTTLLDTAPLNAGVVSYSTSSLAPGAVHALTAIYGGDINFLASNSATSVTVGALDFTVALTGQSTLSIVPGSAGVYTLQITPMYGCIGSPLTLSASGLPAGATITFNPATIAAGCETQTITATIHTASATARTQPQSTPGRRIPPLALALLLLPLLGAKRMRRAGKRMSRLFPLLLLLGGLATCAAITGCSSTSGFFSQAPQSYNVTITATGGGVTHSIDVTLQLQ